MLALKLLAGALLCFGAVNILRAFAAGTSVSYERKELGSHMRFAKFAAYSLLCCSACTELVLWHADNGWVLGYLVLSVATSGLLMLLVHAVTGLRYPTAHAMLAMLATLLAITLVGFTTAALLS